MRGFFTGCLAMAVLFAASRAEDKSAPPASTAPAAPAPAGSDASIEAAKRQFELLKSVRDPSATKSGLPRVSVPELHTTTPETPPRTATPLKPGAESKSANWLVEAMEKSRDPRKQRDPRQRREDTDEENGLTAGRRTPADERPGALEEKKEPDRTEVEKKEEPAPNPLAPYLAQWMTPKDYALLGTTIEKNAAPADMGSRPAASGPAGGVEFNVPAGSRDGATFRGESTKPVFSKPPENPYLQGLNTPSAPSMAPPVPAATPAMRPAATPPVFMPPAAAPVPPRPKVPDFVKPQTDERYFKQLKRF